MPASQSDSAPTVPPATTDLMLSELQVAALLAKVRAQDASALRAAEALEIATIGAAEAIGLGAQVGSIETGQAADLACIRLGDAGTQPVYNPVSQLVYAASADQVTDVWVAGRQLVTGGELTHADVPSILARCDEWRSRINVCELVLMSSGQNTMQRNLRASTPCSRWWDPEGDFRPLHASTRCDSIGFGNKSARRLARSPTSVAAGGS